MTAAIPRIRQYLAILATMAVWTGIVGAAEAPLPRYKLQVGQELRYSGHSEFKYQSGQHNSDLTWRIWVVRQNADGGWHLILRSGSTRTQISQRGPTASTPRDETVSFAWCDISPTGKVTENDSLGFQMRPNTILPRLPDDAAAAKAGWTSENRRLDELNRYQLLPDQSTPERATIEVVRESNLNVIYGSTYQDVVTFDLARGLPERFASKNTQTYGFNGQGAGTTQLDDVQTHDAAWTHDFAADADRYFAAKQAYEKASAGRNQSPEDLEKSLQKGIAELSAAQEQVTTPELKEQLAKDIQQHDRYTKYYLDDAKKRVALLNHPAADWTCQDLQGQDHALKDLRGRVVVLDFWYRGCGWCIRAMPQMKEIATHFQDKPVTIFGMNTDRNEEDAHFVVEKMGLNYTSLKAQGIPEKYDIHGFPTLLIIDQEGTVRDIHVGYSPTLKEEVVKSIEALLNRKT